ncbi:MAG: N-6 DNA methylase [Muribaculaceae bacterium]|nr:N-6 DNA methylase [Muribaculaceae bacterium]
MASIKRNERDWAGQLISWLKEDISKGTTTFEDATNDTSVSIEGGRTKFPDILIFSNKTSGLIFNGWELKFPDTKVDDVAMLENALEKARRINSDSFVTWNGAEAIIWKIDTDSYSLENLTILKRYPKVKTINYREDLADPTKYSTHEASLRRRASEILHDLDMLRLKGELKTAINISGNIIEAIKRAQNIIVPQFREAINIRIGESRDFRNKYNQWKIYESSTLKILGSSSRKVEFIDEKQVLATFTFYNVIGKLLFYLTLHENLPAQIPLLTINNPLYLQKELETFFGKAKEIDYQAIFMPYFTDEIAFSKETCEALSKLIDTLKEFDFKILPAGVIGTILENLVPDDEKQKLGQYFTSEHLADLVAFPAVIDRNAMLFDPTAGTGSFLNSFYKILSYWGNNNHQKLLRQIWGNDISHFPAILSVINLYKQDVTQSDNFPRVIREDFFNLYVGKDISFPDSSDYSKHLSEEIPLFDGIASNFPFIQQEDIPNDKLTFLFKETFGKTQRAFIKKDKFHINERADYFAYCVYNSLQFLKPGGVLSVITSNAWLGKDYGLQFKDFLLNNFHIKYVVRSTAEHWFSDSQVSTLFFVAEKGNLNKPTKFVNLNFKLSYFFEDTKDVKSQLEKIENLYLNIDNSEPGMNPYWKVDNVFPEKVNSIDNLMEIVTVDRDTLLTSLSTGINWDQFFTAVDPLKMFDRVSVQYYPNVVNVIRGERTGWNPMFIIPDKEIETLGIESKYLKPYIKSPVECRSIKFAEDYRHSVFVCATPIDSLDTATKKWINRFVNTMNRNGSLTVPQACAGHKPFWYSINPKTANIITAINPYERFFFTYSPTPFAFDQRMTGLQISKKSELKLVCALLNSIVTFLTLEFKGTSRNLGALDLNANYFKTIKLPDPSLISPKDRQLILKNFKVLESREIGTVFEEVKRKDRIEFDKAVLRAYNLPVKLLDFFYELLITSVRKRVSLKNK